jgi:hypothetical protein
MKLSIEAELIYNSPMKPRLLLTWKPREPATNSFGQNRPISSPQPHFFPIPPRTVTGAYGLRSPAMSQSAILP